MEEEVENKNMGISIVSFANTQNHFEKITTIDVKWNERARKKGRTKKKLTRTCQNRMNHENLWQMDLNQFSIW